VRTDEIVHIIARRHGEQVQMAHLDPDDLAGLGHPRVEPTRITGRRPDVAQPGPAAGHAGQLDREMDQRTELQIRSVTGAPPAGSRQNGWLISGHALDVVSPRPALPPKRWT